MIAKATFCKGLMCKLLKIKWSGRVDSNHRPLGPNLWTATLAGLWRDFVAKQQLLIDEACHQGQKVCPVESIAHAGKFSIDDPFSASPHIGRVF